MAMIQLVPATPEGCGLFTMFRAPCMYHENGGRFLLELSGPRIKCTRKHRVTANGRDIGRWAKRSDREWDAYLDDGSCLSSDRLHKLEFEVLKVVASQSDDERLRAIWDYCVATTQSSAA